MQAIADTEKQLHNPPSRYFAGASDYSLVFVPGGSEESSPEERFAIWREERMSRLEFLRDRLEKCKRKTQQYYQTLETMRQEPWGEVAAIIVVKKYYSGIRPDSAIYDAFVFCSKRQFYYLHSKAIRFIFEVLPDVFLRK